MKMKMKMKMKTNVMVEILNRNLNLKDYLPALRIILKQKFFAVSLIIIVLYLFPFLSPCLSATYRVADKEGWIKGNKPGNDIFINSPLEENDNPLLKILDDNLFVDYIELLLIFILIYLSLNKVLRSILSKLIEKYFSNKYEKLKKFLLKIMNVNERIYFILFIVNLICLLIIKLSSIYFWLLVIDNIDNLINIYNEVTKK